MAGEGFEPGRVTTLPQAPRLVRTAPGEAANRASKPAEPDVEVIAETVAAGLGIMRRGEALEPETLRPPIRREFLIAAVLLGAATAAKTTEATAGLETNDLARLRYQLEAWLPAADEAAAVTSVPRDNPAISAESITRLAQTDIGRDIIGGVTLEGMGIGASYYPE